MTRRTVVTIAGGTVRWSLPVMPFDSAPALIKRATLGDAEVVVRWLNDARGSGLDRITTLQRRLQTLSSGLRDLRQTHTRLRAMVQGRRPKGLQALGARYEEAYRQLTLDMNELNRTLRRYIFRPSIGHSTITDTGNAGLFPDGGKPGFCLKIGEWKLLEADAAMSLVRLYLTGSLDRIALCDNCKKRWLVRLKKHYRFCPGGCRQSYYKHSPDYTKRKRANQQRYRDRIKRAQAALLA